MHTHKTIISVMATEQVELRSHVWKHHASANTTTIAPAKEVLDIVHFHYAWILFVLFLAAFVTNSILKVDQPSADGKGPVLLGPGGKPLPQSARKLKEERERRQKLLDFSPGRKVVFLYLAIGILGTFVANGTEIVIHALTKSENGWWCGKEMAVSI
jgi:hypothetical protein